MSSFYVKGKLMYKNFFRRLRLAVFTIFLACSFNAQAADVLNMDLESLMQIKVTSAGRKEQNIMDTPAAIYVLSREDIADSGATSIPEVLRTVPGLAVSRNSSGGWAVSSRGFHRTFSNKLLVQIDGRSVYTPAYSGVYWDMQNVLLEDVDRIEVIRGPGATLWGSNAVNGIINIITRQASDTQGGLVSIAGGNHERLIASARYGAQIGDNTYGRVYLHRHNQDNYTYLSDKSNAEDDWDVSQGGFRLEGDIGRYHSWTVQGDIYNNDMSQQVDHYLTMIPPYDHTIVDNFAAKGRNLITRWEYKKSETNKTTLQLYYDYTSRNDIFLHQINHKVDLDLQQHIQPWQQHDIVWGVGYRNNRDEFDNRFQASMVPDKDTTELISGFIQDEINLVENRLWVTAGVKVEDNNYSGTEYQPNLRLLWKPAKQHRVWLSASQAVRTPSRVEVDGRVIATIVEVPLPDSSTMAVPIMIHGSKQFDSEKLTAYEVGYRFISNDTFSVDLACFYNRYKNLLTLRPNLEQMSISLINGQDSAYSYGLEMSTKWAPTEWLATTLNYSFNKMSVAQQVEGTNQSFDEGATTPKHNLSSQFNFKITDDLKLNLLFRYVDSIKHLSTYTLATGGTIIDDYTEMDATFRWSVREGIEVTLAGRNLLDSRHLEAIADSYIEPIEVGRSIYGKLTWIF